MSYAETRLSGQPDTYAELGAAVPFTTPALAGARARSGKRGMELTLPNPSGKRGVYILEAAELGRYCQASVHDRYLALALHRLPAITPGSLRQAAREVARAGFAGREAAAAARAAAKADEQAALTMQLAIVRMLVRQSAGSDAAARELPARRAIEAVGARAGQSFLAARAAIETLATLSIASGLPQAEDAAHPALLNAMARLATAVGRLAGQEGGRPAVAAALVASAVKDARVLAGSALSRVWAFLDNIPSVLIAYLGDPATVLAAYERLDWLLDGWTMPCLVLERAKLGWDGATVIEMGMMVPPIPPEAGSWFCRETGEAARQSQRAELLGFSDWRKDGLALDLIARNEMFRAMAA
jgi:hypothetical protein